MKLIKKLGIRLSKNGRSKTSWGLYQCPNIICNKQVERPLSNGLKAKSCGCQKNELISITKIGEKHPLYGKQHTEKVKQKISKAHKGKKHTEESKQKIKENHADFNGKNNPNYGNGDKIKGNKNPMYGKYGELSGNWNNGSSFLPYSPEFNKQLKQAILERDDYTCQCPDCENKTGLLDIHHIDFNKQNNNSENLIALCRSCHSKTFGKKKRQYWIEFYQNIINKLL